MNDELAPRLLRPLPGTIGMVSQWFGEHPDWYAKYKLAGHDGLDYAAPLGTPVFAVHDGAVAVGSDPAGYGTFVKVRAQASGYETIYAHLSAICVLPGQLVAAGMKIGEVGSTGNSTGPHLHLGFRLLGGRNPAYSDWVDPAPFRAWER